MHTQRLQEVTIPSSSSIQGLVIRPMIYCVQLHGVHRSIPYRKQAKVRRREF